MFLPGFLIWLVRNGWLMFLHLSARTSFPQPLSRDEEARLIRRMMDGDKSAEAALIEHNLRLAAHIARKYAQPGVDQDDLVSVGSLGLIKGVQTFKPEAGRLTSYVSRCIENEILMYFRANKKHRADVLMGDTLSEDDDGQGTQLGDLLGTDPEIVPDEAEIAIESGRAVRLMARVLDAREQKVIRLRYGLEDGEPLPQREVAVRLNISRSYVSRIEKHALEKLRKALDGRS